MGDFSDFLAIFQNNFVDSWDVHGMRPIILGYFLPAISMEVSFISRPPWNDENLFWALYGKMWPLETESPHILCSGIGPLQLRVVPV